MCQCKSPNVNGTPGAYSWDGEHFSTRPPNPPTLTPDDVLIFDEPGRCGGIDSHCHHMVLTKRGGRDMVICRHGGGTVEHEIRSYGRLDTVLRTCDSNTRYWLLLAIWRACEEAAAAARSKEEARWLSAVVEKRVRVRSRRGRKYVEFAPKQSAATGCAG